MFKDLSATRDFSIRDANPSDGEFIARNVLAAMGYDVFTDAAADSIIEVGSASLNIQGGIKAFGDVCARPDTLYSYARTRVACVDGKAVGTLTAYSGDDYQPLRDLTWGLLNAAFENIAAEDSTSDSVDVSGRLTDRAEISSNAVDGTEAQAIVEQPSGEDSSGALSMEPECRPGEFYLDSMAILPEYRRMTFEYAGSTDRIGHLLMLDGIEQGRRKGFPRISLIVDKAKPRLKAYYSALGFRPDGEILFFGHLYDRMIKDLD